jgi:hypothetical protein
MIISIFEIKQKRIKRDAMTNYSSHAHGNNQQRTNKPSGQPE